MSYTIPAWQARAACRHTDPDLFFPELAGEGDEAKRICAGCPVRADCGAWAAANNFCFGIWGGVDFEQPRSKRLCRNNLHVMDAVNTYVDSDGHRNCRDCRYDADQRARQRREGEAA